MSAKRGPIVFRSKRGGGLIVTNAPASALNLSRSGLTMATYFFLPVWSRSPLKAANFIGGNCDEGLRPVWARLCCISFRALSRSSAGMHGVAPSVSGLVEPASLMKLLGVIFLLISMGVALYGYAETSDGSIAPFAVSALRNRERIADAKFYEASQTALAMMIIYTGDTSSLHEIKDPLARQRILETLKLEGKIENPTVQKLIADNFGEMAEQRGRLDVIHAKITEKQKWTYTPAAILAVIGLILLVIPTTPKRDIYLRK